MKITILGSTGGIHVIKANYSDKNMKELELISAITVTNTGTFAAWIKTGTANEETTVGTINNNLDDTGYTPLFDRANYQEGIYV